MHHPFQCLLYCYAPGRQYPKILAAALGSYIYTFDVETGNLLFTWSSVDDTHPFGRKTEAVKVPAEPNEDEHGDGDDVDEPATKRRKTAPATTRSDSSSAEIVIENDTNSKTLFSNSIIKLAATVSGEYIIVVTSEDKCLRVLEVAPHGGLRQINERIMPKRPCAIATTPDDSTILIADKFGDVWSLPLLGQSYEFARNTGGNARLPDQDGQDEPLKPFVSSASSLTVHTKKNLHALKQQQKQFQKKSTKTSLVFDHQLLLGHVSLLTDLAYVKVSHNLSKPREYILTADRDEHIRVSRGIPQTHIIEGFCLGHTQFVSKICILEPKSHLLVSGGGDDYLLLWSWPVFTAKQKIDLKHPFDLFREQYNTTRSIADTRGLGEDNVSHIAVSQIHVINTSEHSLQVMVTLEAVPALFFFQLGPTEVLTYLGVHAAPGNIIDAAVLPDTATVLYSMDTIHSPFSTTMAPGNTEAGEQGRSRSHNNNENLRPSISALHYDSKSASWREYSESLPALLLQNVESCARSRPFVTQTTTAKGKSLRELLYGLESLRKRTGGVEMEGEGEEVE